MKTLLYIHGMGGGGDSRIPRELSELIPELRTVVRTYSFDPEVGYRQIQAWMQELQPSLVVGESLGASQTLRVRGVPHILVSPALGAPENLYRRAWIARFALGRWLLHKKFPVKEGDRQELIFTYPVMSRYREHWARAQSTAREELAAGGYFFAFFGRYDHFMRSGVVKISACEELFGKDSYRIYDGSHFMEEQYVASLLVPKIREVLALQK